MMKIKAPEDVLAHSQVQRLNDLGTGGLTLRDWFAGQAMIGLFAGRWVPNAKHDVGGFEKAYADYAYAVADMMLERRGIQE